MYTVAELIKELEKVTDKTRLVILSKDEEGNGYEELRDIGGTAYDKVEHEIGLEELDEDNIQAGYTEEDVLKGDNVVKALLLTP